MNADKLNEMMSEVLPMCNDLNGSENHLYDWMKAGNKDGVFDGMSAEQIAEMWNKEMAAYRAEQGDE